MAEALEGRVLLSTFDVTNANDSGVGSLRRAILDSNGNGGTDTIVFHIGGSGVHVIAPLSPLPQITDPVIIDGSTQPGFAGQPLIQLDGSEAGASVDGLDISAGHSTVKDLVISHFSGSGISLFTGGGNLIENNYLGTDATGAAPAGNTFNGLAISGGSSANQVVNNVISANGAANQFPGIQIWGTGTNNNVVVGNLIGTDATGTKALGNGGTGVLIQLGAQNNLIGTNGDGNNDAAERNIISANGRDKGFDGIQIDGAGSDRNVIAGNYIGTDISGAKGLGNGGIGVLISGGAKFNRVGANGADLDAAGERNVISANGFPNFFSGVMITGAGTDQNVVAGNLIGTTADGSMPLGNAGVGVILLDGAQSNRIGTDGNGVGDQFEGNTISASGYQGIAIQGSGTNDNIVAGNRIGASPRGSASMGNEANGVWILQGAQGNRIGVKDGDADPAAEGNTIDGNAFAGVAVTDHSTGNSIRGNSIEHNGGIGIDLGADGMTLNHGSALQAGPNNWQNHPTLLSAGVGAATTVTGTLVSLPSTNCRLDFYASPSAADPFHGAGERWLWSAMVTTSLTGAASFSATVGVTVDAEWITATATDASGNTSEFSSPIEVATSQPTINAAIWTPIGPAPINETQTNSPVVSGRVSVAADDPTNPNLMYLGADGGGVWKTTDWLDPVPHWTPLTDNQPSLAFSNISYTALAVAPGDSHIVYAALSGPGGGILKSADAGATWTELANDQFNYASFATLRVSPTDANALYVSVWYGAMDGGGVYKSTDGGVSWTNTTSFHNGAAADLVMDPSNPSVLYAGLVQGGATNGIYKTSDGGAHWQLLSNGVLSGTGVGVSIRLAISPSSPNIVYATVFDPALGGGTDGLPHRYKTIDGGMSWSPLGTLTDVEPRYWHAVLSVDPTDPNKVYVNGDHTLYQSIDGGATWHNVYDEDPVNVSFDDGGAVVMTGDRGIYRWPGGAFQNKHGDLQNTEFYTLTLDPTNPSVVYGVAQDHTNTLKSFGSPVWNYVNGGDEVGRVLVDPANPDRIYDYDPNNTTSFVIRSDDGGANWVNKGTGIPTASAGFGLSYTAEKAFVMDPANDKRLLVGTDRVYESTNSADSWQPISPQLSPGNYLTALAIALSHDMTVYAATADGRLFATDDDSTWHERDAGLPIHGNNHVMDLQVNPSDPQNVFAVTGDFIGGRTGAGHVWATTDGGTSWRDISGNLPGDDAGQAIAVDWRFAVPVLYVGTVRGVFRSTDSGGHWAKFGTMPNALVTDLQISTQFNVLAASTYGRGAFEIRIPTPLALLGDANEDGKVDFADLVILARNYGKTNATWADGDFNGDGSVGFDDLVILARNYGRTSPAAAPAASADDPLSRVLRHRKRKSVV